VLQLKTVTQHAADVNASPKGRPNAMPVSGPAVPTISPVAAVLASACALGVIGIGDYLTEWYILFDLFYLVPLAVVTVYAGRRAGMWMALACTAVWAASFYPHVGSFTAAARGRSPLVWVWNSAGRFGLQAAFVWVLASLRDEIAEQRRLVAELHAALDQVAQLKELLPICAWCKKIRDDTGYWKQLDLFMQEHDYAKFTHGICPDCEAKLKAEYKRIPKP
jgi:hypothetical protein